MAIEGLGHHDAQATMAAAMGSAAEVTAAAHLPDRALTLFRIAGFAPSVAALLDGPAIAWRISGTSILTWAWAGSTPGIPLDQVDAALDRLVVIAGRLTPPA